MKEATVGEHLHVTIRDVDLPTVPTEHHLIIKVYAASLNPKDWAMSERCKSYQNNIEQVLTHARVPDVNQGDDIAGIVHSVGSGVSEFRPGDRVASFHEMMTPHGAYGEYAVGLADTTFHLPNHVSFEEASTIPLAGMTAAIGLYQRLGLPLPWSAARNRLPLVIWGASSAVGMFAIKLATLSNIHPLICIAGKGRSAVESLMDHSEGDVVIDYRQDKNNLVADLRAALHENEKVCYAFDAVSDHGSYQTIMEIMDRTRGKITFVLARKKYDGVPDTIEQTYTQVGRAHSQHYPGLKTEKSPVGKLNDQEFAVVMYRFFSRGLFKGWFSGHPYQVIPNGLDGLSTALKDLKGGKASAFKYVLKLADDLPSTKAQL